MGKPKFKQSDEITFIQKHESTSAPVADNDGVDTAGLGKTFRVGDKWIKTDTNTIYTCDDNSTGSAVWTINVSMSMDNLHVNYNNSLAGATYAKRATYIFSGTDNFSPTQIIVSTFRNNENNEYDLRIRDITNSQTIAELLLITETVETLKDMGSLSNLSTGLARWEIQSRKDGGAGADPSITIATMMVST